jgi:hypothetical protein
MPRWQMHGIGKPVNHLPAHRNVPRPRATVDRAYGLHFAGRQLPDTAVDVTMDRRPSPAIGHPAPADRWR